MRGKGNKERLVPVVGNVARALGDWLIVPGSGPGSLFCGLGNRNRGGRLTTQANYKMLRVRAKAAGVENLLPHDFRRTLMSELLDRGADLATVQKLTGHAGVTTTARYDRRGERVKRTAAELLHALYRQRV